MNNNIDLHIGNKIRTRRYSVGMSQANLGKKLGVAFQQIQKYENGNNKISVSKLYNLAVIMDVPITYFFEDYNDKNIINAIPLDQEKGILDTDNNKKSTTHETITLVKTYNNISNENTKKKLISFLKAIASTQR